MYFYTTKCNYGYLSIATSDGLLVGIEITESPEQALLLSAHTFKNNLYHIQNSDLEPYYIDLYQRIVNSINNQLPDQWVLNKVHFLTGTPFQQLVWRELMKIGKNEQLTYKDVANRIGKPKSYRAVGTACGKNPIAIIVPCHRVIGKSNPNAYKWGSDFKKLLNNELQLIVDDVGNKYWYKDELLHRENGPAKEWATGTKEWYINGQTHRLDGPAVEWVNGDKAWFINGKQIDCQTQEEFERIIKLLAFE